jgi:hypothetical protein
MTRPLLILVLAMTVLAGCGGGDDASTEDFVADANKICREGAAKIQARAHGRGVLAIYGPTA